MKKSFVAVACFLPGRAKDLSAPLCPCKPTTNAEEAEVSYCSLESDSV